MSRTLTRITWVLFVAVMYLVLTEAIAHWVKLPGLGNIGFTLVFVLFATVDCAGYIGWRRTGIFFILAATVSFTLEEIGVLTGMVYGPYHYSDMLGVKLGHVPVLIPLAWFMMIYPSWLVGIALLRGVETRTLQGRACLALIAALVMTAWDTVMDPGMAAAGNWVWERGGPYFGVPLQNYFGWVLTTFLVYLGAGVLWPRERLSEGVGKGVSALPIILYAFYGFSYAMPRTIPALQIVAVFAMVLPGLLALAQVWMAKDAVKPRESRQRPAEVTDEYQLNERSGARLRVDA